MTGQGTSQPALLVGRVALAVQALADITDTHTSLPTPLCLTLLGQWRRVPRTGQARQGTPEEGRATRV